jgi:hypothetical protein
MLQKKMILFLGAFAKLRKATFSCLTSVCVFVCPSARTEQLGSHWTDFHEILYLRIFRKSVEKIQVSLKFHKNNGCFMWRLTYFHDNIFVQFLSEWEMIQWKVVKKIETDISCSNNFFPWKSCHLWGNVGKYRIPGQDTDAHTIRRVHFACWNTKAAKTHSAHAIFLAILR